MIDSGDHSNLTVSDDEHDSDDDRQRSLSENSGPKEFSRGGYMEVRRRFQALRVVREEKLDGIVMFADDSNRHSMELFDEIQKVNWIGAVSVGILVHSSNSDDELSVVHKEEDVENSPMPVQGPACNSSDKLVGWHTFNSLPYVGRSANYIGDRAVVLPRKMEWAGFVLNSRLLWKESEDKPKWVKDLDSITGDGEDIQSPLSLLKDPSVVEPLGSCGRKVLLWWLRVEARADSKFPASSSSSSNVHVKEVSSGTYFGEGEYFGGYEGSSLFNWYRETYEGNYYT